MESEAKYTLVGGFVIGAMVLGVLAVIWLSGSTNGKDLAGYTIYFRNQSLNGLQLNSAVTMKGIKVGVVDKLEISPRNIELVQVVIKVEKTTPVKTDTAAVINRNLLTGFALVDLVGGKQETPVLREVRKDEQFPVIPEGSSGFDAVASSLPELMNEATEVLTRAKLLLSEENVTTVSKTLHNAEQISATLARNSARIDSVINNADELISQLEKASANLARFTQPGQGELAKLTAEFNAAIEELKKAVTTISNKGSDVAKEVTNSLRVVAQDISTAAMGVAQASRSFSSTAEHLGDLRTVITGPSDRDLGPGEQKPK